jgi:hypothetical protein
MRCFGVCSFNANEEERGGSRRRMGCGPEQLAAMVPSALFTVVYGEEHTAFSRVLLIF